MDECFALGSQKRASCPLELELQRAVTTTWVLGTQSRSSARAASALNH